MIFYLTVKEICAKLLKISSLKLRLHNFCRKAMLIIKKHKRLWHSCLTQLSAPHICIYEGHVYYAGDE